MERTGRPLRPFSLLLLTAFAVSAVACSEQAPAESATAAAAPPTSSSLEIPLEPAAAAPAASAEPVPAETPAETANPSQPLDPNAMPDVVARIDGEAITKVELMARAVEARGALAERGMRLPAPNRGFYRKVLDDLIGNRLLHRDLAAQSKEATPEEVAARLQAIRAQFQSDEELDRALAERGFDRPMFERDLLESATVQKWVTTEVIPSISVSEEEARAFYDANPERMFEPERIRARHILVRVAPQASAAVRQEARRRIEELRARLDGGAEFAALARESSEDKPSAERGGDLGWFYRGQMVPAFEEAAFALAPNQLSQVVETRFGYHLIELLEKRARRDLAFDELRSRLEETLRQRQLEEKVRARINELGARAEIEILI